MRKQLAKIFNRVFLFRFVGTQSNKRSWKRRRLESAKRLSFESSITELQNWISKSNELLTQNHSLDEKFDLYHKIETEMISKRDELKGIQLLADECVEEIASDSGKFFMLKKWES